MCLLCLMSTAGTPDPIPAAGREVSDYTALLAYLDYSWGRWNATERLRTPVIVSYTFTETADLPSLAEFDPYGSDGYFSFNADQRAAFRQAVEILEKVAGVVMVEKPGAEAMINVFNSDGSQWSGWANYPSVSEYGSSGGNLVLDYPVGTNYRPGTDAFQVMLHELGHAMGLKHPFEGSVQLIDRFDNTYNTLMSYDWSGGTKSGFSHLDVDALTHLYGTQTNTTGWRMSWGADEFRLTASGRAEFLIALPNERNVVRAAGGNDTVLGGSEADRIWGQSGHDTLRGAYGDDKIYGGAGADRLEGGHGSDTLLGGAGADKLSNGTADAHTYGDSDILRGEAGNDRLFGGAATDLLLGGSGSDRLDGGSDTLRASTLWDVEDDGRLAVRHGDSFIMWIEWAPGARVASRSIQPFGAATTRPASPHYTDQMQLFVDHKLKPVHFWRDDLLAKASNRRAVTTTVTNAR